MGLQFVNTWILYLVWLAPLLSALWILADNRRRMQLDQFVAPAMRQKLSPPHTCRRFRAQAVLLASGLLLAMLAAARPQWGEAEEVVFQRGRDLVIALDVSRSMLARDVHPNRLTRAKVDLLDLIQDLQGDRAALLAFRYQPRLLCPLTSDYGFLRQSLDGVSIDSAPRGPTDIGAAIRSALDLFDDQSPSHKAILLISDGEDLTGEAVAAATAAGERKIPIFTVGIGSLEGGRIPDPDSPGGFLTHEGETVVSRLEPEALQTIARLSGGVYIPVGTASTANITLGSLYRDYLRDISAREFEETMRRRRIERYPLFLLPAIVLLMAAAAFSQGRIAPHATLPGSTHAALAAGLFFLTGWLPDAARAQSLPVGSTTNAVDSAVTIDVPPGPRGALAAQKMYRRGNYRKAAAAYLAAAQTAGVSAQQVFRYNAALALYQAGDYRQAEDILYGLTTANRHQQDVAMLLGSSRYQAAMELSVDSPEDAHEKIRLLEGAGDAFRQAWRMQKHESAAAQNLLHIQSLLPNLRRETRILELLERYQDTSASELAERMLTEQRRLTRQIPDAITLSSPRKIQQLESLARDQQENAERWIALKHKLYEALQQQRQDPDVRDQLEQFYHLVEANRDRMTAAASYLRDLNPEGQPAAQQAQEELYPLWKSIAAYPSILREDISRQTNSLHRTVAINPQDSIRAILAEQTEAGELTGLFVERFLEHFPEDHADDAAPRKETPQLSEEDRRQILMLAAEAQSLQAAAAAQLTRAAPAEAIPYQEQSLEALRKIEELLPRQEQSAAGQQDQPPSADQEQTPQDPQTQPQGQQDEEAPAAAQNDDEQEAEDDQPTPGEQNEEEMPEDIRRMFERVLQRERDYQDQQRQRQRQVPLPAGKKDW